MRITLRVIGFFLLVMGAINLLSLIEPELLHSPVLVFIRYSLMLAAGLGFVLLYKWGVVIYFSSLAINWLVYFLVYDGAGAIGPLWLTLPVPTVIAVISYLGWSQLRWS